MRPLGSQSKKARWYFWGDKIPTRFRRYYNRAVRGMFKKQDNNQQD